MLTINQGALEALENDGRSLLRVGVVDAKGDFVEGDAVEIRGPEGQIVAKGLTKVGAEGLTEFDDVVVHRDDLVLLRRV
jgi:glutamate 5-kinase